MQSSSSSHICNEPILKSVFPNRGDQRYPIQRYPLEKTPLRGTSSCRSLPPISPQLTIIYHGTIHILPSNYSSPLLCHSMFRIIRWGVGWAYVPWLRAKILSSTNENVVRRIPWVLPISEHETCWLGWRTFGRFISWRAAWSLGQDWSSSSALTSLGSKIY